MKIMMKPIEMIAWFDLGGLPRPVRFRIDGEVVKVQKLCGQSEERFAGNKTKIFRCESVISGQLKTFELKYELQTCKWFLYKM